MAWAPPQEIAPRRAPSSMRRLVLVLAAPASVVGALTVVGILATTAVRASAPLAQSLSVAPVATPYTGTRELEPGEYTVFELTGHRTGSGGVTWTVYDTPVLTPDEVVVRGDSGALDTFPTRGATQSITRGSQTFYGSVRFVVPAAGRYDVAVQPTRNTQVIIAPSLRVEVGALRGIGPAVSAAGLVTVAGLAVLVVALIGGRQKKPPGPVAAAFPPAWYPDPWGHAAQRWWDGITWTPHVR